MSEYPLPLVSLQELLEDEYIVRASEEYEGRRKTPKDPFFQMIPCRKGVTIWPYGAELLGVSVKGKMIDKLMATGVIIEDKSAICRDDPTAFERGEIFRLYGYRFGCYLQKPTVDDLESNLVFHIDGFETVAKMVGARKRRKLSPAQKKQRLKNLEGHRPKTAA